MKYLLSLCTFVSLSFAFNVFANSDKSLVIVANLKNEPVHITRRDIRSLFMGGVLKYDLHAVILPPESDTRVLFNTKVVGLTESRIQSYWAQMRFSGRKKEPKQISSEQKVIEYLLNNQGATAYLPAESTIPEELTVLLRI